MKCIAVVMSLTGVSWLWPLLVTVLCFLDTKSEAYFSSTPSHHDVKPHYRPRCNEVRNNRLDGAETKLSSLET